jgi:hypothetical protein
MPENDWQLSKISGELEPPKLRWLLDRLGELAPDAEHALICKHANKLDFMGKILAVGFARRAYKIGAAGKTYFANPIKAPGRTAELQRLECAAKTGSLKRWLGAWAGVSLATHDDVIKHLPDRLRPNRGIPPSWVCFSAPGLTTNAPPATAALAAIIAARESLNAVAAQERKKRICDPEEVRFVAALKECFREITGRRKAGVTRNAVDDEYCGDFLKLVRDIDATYGTVIVVPHKKPTRLLRK